MDDQHGLGALLQAYDRIAASVSPRPLSFRRGVVAISTHVTASPLDVDAAIAELGRCIGWAIRWSARSQVWASAVPADPPIVDSRPGSAELVGEDGRSLAIVDLGGAWRMTWSEDGGTVGNAPIRIEGLVETRSHLVAARFALDVGTIDHEIVWAEDPTVGFGPRFSRFVGFDTRKASQP